MVKLNFGEIVCFYSDLYKKIACRIYYNSPGLVITCPELPVDDIPTYIINEIKAVMNRALQQNNMDLYNKFMQDLNAISQAIANPSPTPPPPLPLEIPVPPGADLYEEIKKAYFPPTTPAPTPTPPPPATEQIVPRTTMVPQKPSIVPVEEWKPQAYVTPPTPTSTPTPTPTPPAVTQPTTPSPVQPTAPPPIQPQTQPQPSVEKKEEEKRIDLRKLALVGLIGYLLVRKK